MLSSDRTAPTQSEGDTGPQEESSSRTSCVLPSRPRAVFRPRPARAPRPQEGAQEFDKKKTIGGLVKVVVGLIVGLVIAASVSVGIAASQDRLLTL